MNVVSVLWILVLLAFPQNGSALSTLAPPAKSRPKTEQQQSVLSQNFLVASLKRSDLKRKLIQAANRKDETAVLTLVDQLAEFNPTKCPTLGLQGYKTTSSSNVKPPLNGKWRLLFTNAKDAEAPARTEKNKKGEPFGDAVKSGVDVRTGQRIDAAKGECVNFIQLGSNNNSLDDAKKLPFDRLDITIQMTPLTDTRVRLDFLKGRVQNPNAPLPALRDFRFSFPPAAFGDFLARLRGKDPNIEPPAFFDVLYVDNDLRAHRTGEGKIFVQQRDN
jgi:hypothetical protein